MSHECWFYHDLDTLSNIRLSIANLRGRENAKQVRNRETPTTQREKEKHNKSSETHHDGGLGFAGGRRQFPPKINS